MSRNFYLIAHRCNSLSKIRKSFKQGVNGIECDLWYDDEKKWWVSHDGFQKNDLIEWLEYIGHCEEKYHRQLAVIVFDIKQPECIVGLRQTINASLPPGLSHVYSVAKLNDAHILSEIVPLLSPTEAIAIDEEDDPEEVAAFFIKAHATQCWYGNGITLMPLDGQFHDSMKQAASIRDSTGPFSKIYTWSIHHKKHMRRYILDDKVDGMIVGLNGILTRPVSKALKILNKNNIILSDRASRLF